MKEVKAYLVGDRLYRTPKQAKEAEIEVALYALIGNMSLHEFIARIAEDGELKNAILEVLNG